jgi:tetratricopeptide (TPR) repeat protein
MGANHSEFHMDWMHAGRHVLTCAAFAIIAAAFCCAGCGRGGSFIAGKEAIKRIVKVENNVDALRAWAVNGARASVLVHIDFSDDMAVFTSAQMEDMENAARLLGRRDASVLEKVGSRLEPGGTVSLGYMAGMYKRVIWVVPSIRPAGEAINVYRNYLVGRRKFPAAAIADFKVEGPYVKGSVAGVPLTITRLADLALGEGETAIIDIDLQYFPMMKGENPAYRLGTGTMLGFLRELGERNVRANLVTVNLSTQNRAVGIDLRCFGDVIREALMKPADLNGPVPEKWRQMMQAEDSLVAKRYASAESIYANLIAKVKNDPGLYFSLALAQGFQGKGAECRTALLSAYRLDNEYLKGFFQLARALGDAGKIEAGLEILGTPDLQKIFSKDEMAYQRGVFFYVAHRPADAAVYLASAATSRPKDFGLYTILLRAQREAGNEIGETLALNKLIRIDDGRVKREMPWVYADLGQLFEKRGLKQRAGEMFEKYMEARPGDSLSTEFKKKIDAWKAKKLIAP